MLLNKNLNKYYLRYAFYIIVGIVAVVVVDFFQLNIPEDLGKIVDIIKDNEKVTFDLIKPIVLDVLMVALILCFGRMCFRFMLFYASQHIEAGLRYDMFLKSERLSQRYYHENKVGTIMSWFTTDLETIEEFTGWGTIMMVDAIFLSVIVIVKMIRLEPVLSLICISPMILIIIWGALVEKFMSMKWEERQREFDNLYDFSQESFTGIRVIKAFVKGNQQIRAFSKIARKNKDTNIKYVKVSVIFDVIIEVIISAIMAIIIGVGSWFTYLALTNNPMVIFGHTIDLSAGDLVVFIGFFETLIWPMIAMGQIVSMRSRAKTSLKRVSNFLNQDEEIHNPENAHVLTDVLGKIEFKNYSFSYPGSKNHSLEKVSFVINAGETIGIVGKIGSGKTTLVNSLLRLYNIEKGTIFIDGNDIMECDIQSIRNCIGYVPQDNFLFSDKIKNNIAFSNHDLDFSRIQNAARFADVDDNINGFRNGYDTVSGERGVTLSGGQKQRISIARAYAKEAPIMIMDDSVSAVDVKTEENILKNIKEYRNGKTTIVIASRVSTVQHMSRILVLNEGRVEAFDTHDNLLKISPTYQKMVFLQELEKEVEGGIK